MKNASNSTSISLPQLAAVGLLTFGAINNAMAFVNCEEAILKTPAPSCPDGSYRVLSGTDIEMCDAKKTEPDSTTCVTHGSMEPPTPAWIDCRQSGSGDAICTAWPQGDLDFDWAVSERLELVEPVRQIQPGMGGALRMNMGDMSRSAEPVSSHLEILPGSDINLPQTGKGPTQRIQCREPVGSGLVSVTITTPDGLSDTVFAGVHCDEAVL